jgi:hypothetical protein
MKSFPTFMLAFVSYGQNSNHTAERIDSICLSIDNNKNLVEGISEGTVANKRAKRLVGSKREILRTTLYSID